jgi:hypothetical protein
MIQKPKLIVGQMVEVIWADTHTPKHTDWMDDATYQDWTKDGVKVRSVGIIKMLNDSYIGLVGDIDSPKQTNQRTVCRAINIGRGLIKEIRILKRTK